jgi:hypothetical protein
MEIEHFDDGFDAHKLLEGSMLLSKELKEYLIFVLILADNLRL